MGKSSEQHLQMRDDEVNGVPMYHSVPKAFIPTTVYVKDIDTIPILLKAIQDALNEHIELLHEVNKKHNRETLDGFWDYQTAGEAKQAMSDLTKLFIRE